MTQSIDTILLSSSAALSAPDVSRLTTQSLDGVGVFDVLMKTTKLHLLEEYNNGRISGQEYATVFISALGTVMQQSVTFLLNSQQEEKIMAEIALTRQQTVTELAQTDDDIPLGLGFNGDSLVEGLVKLQKDKLTLEGTLVTAQITSSEREGKLIGQKVVTELSQTCDSLALASAAGLGFNDTALIEGMIKAQQAKMVAEGVKMGAEGDLLAEKVITETGETRDKLGAEVTLLAQKANTELAQTDDVVRMGTPYLNSTTSVAGVISKQKLLFERQSDGYLRDAEQKAGKLMTDTYAVQASLDAAPPVTNLAGPSMDAVIAKLKTGIGA